MLEILKCRRSSLAVIAMAILGAAMWSGTDTSSAIASIVVGIGISNATEKGMKAKAGKE